MEKLWAGRTAAALDRKADDFNSSISFDRKMYRQDIRGSAAHAAMLAAAGILSQEESDEIIDGLNGILEDIEKGTLIIDPTAEDIHMFVEAELTKRIGGSGKRLHTARSRNDQVATDLRLYLREETGHLITALKALLSVLKDKAAENKDAIMPGYTHMQRAQPVTFAHHLLAYAMMFVRDIGRLKDAAGRMNVCPLGSCALAGTTYPIDRSMTASLLGFDGYTLNSMDGVSDRDFCVELLSAFSLIMAHLSRFSEELILWSSWEFKFVELDDAFTTGSSIMPQKKNPDMAELIRGKTGRVYGDLMAILTVLKGLPLAYNKDLQEDKETVFDALETVQHCVEVITPMISSLKVLKENMLAAAQKGFINATDLADYLTRKGVPFRAAYKTTGKIVADCIRDGKILETLPLEAYQAYDPLFENDLFEAIALRNCVARRTSSGGTGPGSIDAQLSWLDGFLTAFRVNE